MSATHLTNGIIPLAVLFAGLVAGGIAAIYLTKKITRMRVLRQVALAAQEAQAEEEFMGRKPVLTDIYLASPPPYPDGNHSSRLPWPDLQPISGKLNETYSCPHPHRTFENKPGYAHAPLVDGNVINVAVGIAMPSSSLNTRSPSYCDGGQTAETLDYCIGTSQVVVCTLLGARQRLVGFN